MSAIHNDIAYADRERCFLDLHLPDQPGENTPVVVWFHGGGITSGDRKGDLNLYEAWNGMGIAVAAANYRLMPAYLYPAFIEDAAEAVAWVFAHIREYLPSAGGIFIGGASAGAFLSMSLCFNKSWLGKYGIDPDAAVAGWLHGSAQPTAHFNVLKYRGEDPRRVIVDETAPLYYIDRATFAPMMIITSDDDITNRMNQNILVESTLRAFGFTGEADLRILKGKHCAFLKKDENGRVELAEISRDFIFRNNR